MKKIIVIILLLSMQIISSGGVSTEKKWGYIYHDSRLSDQYIKKNIPEYQVIALTGWKISANGEIKHKNNNFYRKIIKNAIKERVLIYPVFSFKSTGEGKIFIKSKKYIQNAINNISRIIEKNKFSGIHLDLEYLTPDYSGDLEYLLKTLHDKLLNIKLTMAVFPQVEFPEKLSGFHNLEIISQFVDEIVLMCYDYHRPGTEPGPVTEINWAEKNIKYTLKHLDSNQVWLGIPAYGYRWSSASKTIPISARYGIDLAEKHGAIRHSSGNIYFSYSDPQDQYRVFLADRETREQLSKLADRYKLAGTALWRMGFEEEKQ